METPDVPEVPEKWASCSIKIPDVEKAMMICDFFAFNYGLSSMGWEGHGVRLSVKVGKNGEKMYPGDGCRQALEDLIKQGVEIAFS